MGVMSITKTKRLVGAAAANLVQNGMCIGLGTGSTASCFIDALIERVRLGLQITAVATSKASYQQAMQGGILLSEIDEVSTIDLAIDGADEIDNQRRLIKGGGGALLREKIIATSANEMVVMVDETKLVDALGVFGLPVEILPFGHTHTIRKIESLGLKGKLRLKESSSPYLTDNGNYIFDIHFNEPMKDPSIIDSQLKSLPGIIENGLFLNIAGRVVIGYDDGRVEIQGK